MKWASDNEEIATVSQDGTITAHAPGTTFIRIQSVDSGLSDECEVTVEDDITGVSREEKIIAEIRAFPNPAGDRLTICSPEDVKTLVRLIDSGGRIIMEENGEGGTMSLSTSRIASGIYVLTVISGTISRNLMIAVE